MSERRFPSQNIHGAHTPTYEIYSPHCVVTLSVSLVVIVQTLNSEICINAMHTP
jgi:hypothetical protein